MLDKLLYTYVMEENVKQRTKRQVAMYRVSLGCDNYDPSISMKKTEVVYQPASEKSNSKQSLL